MLLYIYIGSMFVALNLGYYYRPQRSRNKVIFSQASVILLTGGGASSRGVLPPGWCFLPGGLAWGGCFLRGGGASSGGGVLPPRGLLPLGLVETLVEWLARLTASLASYLC